ncbi:MAG: hypothetical protein ACH346_08250 [Chthoniobacterales bacterium]
MGILNFFQRLTNPNREADLEGLWERVGDDFEGCFIKVEQEAGELIGKIVWITPEMLSYGWSVNDKKWRRIEGDEKNGWQLLDLRKQFDTATKKVLSTDYAKYWISLSGERKLHLHQSRFPLFAAQTWRKIG